MLAYSGKGRFVIERLNLEQQVRQIVPLIAASIPKGVKVELDFEPGLQPIEGYSGQLQQLIMNLVINGAEAIGEGAGTVTISARLREIDPDYVRDNLAGDNIPPGSYLVLEVHDTGIGMDEATQSVQDPRSLLYDQIHWTRLGSRCSPGNCAGSYHKGALTVYSELGKGTTFKVFLPVTGAKAPLTADPAGSAAEFRGQGTILVVDDEEVIQRTLKRALERYGYKVMTVNGGDQAIAMLPRMRDEIMLILLDMRMPVMSGLRRLRAMEPRIPVVATSGYNEVEALRRFGEGLGGFIQKPFTPRKLAEKIRSVLDRRGRVSGSEGLGRAK